MSLLDTPQQSLIFDCVRALRLSLCNELPEIEIVKSSTSRGTCVVIKIVRDVVASFTDELLHLKI